MSDSIELSGEDFHSALSDTGIRAILNANREAGDLVRQKKFFVAKAALCRALGSSPEDWQIWANLSSVMWHMSAYDQSLMCAEKSLGYNQHPDPKSKLPALLALGNARMSEGQYSSSRQAFLQALEIDPDYRDARWNLSLLNLLEGDYEAGWKDYHLRIDKDFGEYEKDLPSKPWRGEKLRGKSIRVLHDQGVGDTIMYSRFLMDTRLQGLERIYVYT